MSVVKWRYPNTKLLTFELSDVGTRVSSRYIPRLERLEGFDLHQTNNGPHKQSTHAISDEYVALLRTTLVKTTQFFEAGILSPREIEPVLTSRYTVNFYVGTGDVIFMEHFSCEL